MSPKESLPARFLSWLRAGYPTGVSLTDAAPITYVLRHHLTDAEIEEIFSQIIFAKRNGEPVAEGTITHDDIHWFVRSTVNQTANEEDIHRVRERLVAGGLTVEGMED